ncbi:hypothetical protein Sste5346_008806 [Sporothrix stenoceras]|uniref:CBM-cenC domain-containing protein n=1 Tax=Sporothrix stenoceras TaxID=5173 RepID=A0ABR3YNT3_9PEZI
MVQPKSIALALVAFFFGARASPCASCNPANIVQDGSFEAGSSVWTLDSGVTIETDAPDSDYSASGVNYVNIYIAQRSDYARYGLSQQLTGLVPNKPYTLQYTYELTDASGIYDGGVGIQTQLDGVQVDSVFMQSRDQQGIVQVRTVTITPTTANPLLYIDGYGSGNYYYGANVVIDDISLGQACNSGKP